MFPHLQKKGQHDEQFRCEKQEFPNGEVGNILLSGGACFQVEGFVSLPCYGKQYLLSSCPHSGKPGHPSLASGFLFDQHCHFQEKQRQLLSFALEMAVLTMFVNIKYECSWCGITIKTKSLGMAWDRMPFQNSLGRKSAELLVTG